MQTHHFSVEDGRRGFSGTPLAQVRWRKGYAHIVEATEALCGRSNKRVIIARLLQVSEIVFLLGEGLDDRPDDRGGQAGGIVNLRRLIAHDAVYYAHRWDWDRWRTSVMEVQRNIHEAIFFFYLEKRKKQGKNSGKRFMMRCLVSSTEKKFWQP